MQYFIFSILAILFLYLNIKIILSDIKEKKIPNKYLIYLIYLLPFYYIYFFIYVGNVEIIHILIQLLLSFIISFVLYYYSIWSAGDAKYLLILALFIPNIGIVTFIGNIALLTIAYLFLYFLYFYFGRCLTSWKYTKSLYQSIYLDLKGKFKNFIKNAEGVTTRNTIIYKIVRWIAFFVVIFVSIRLIRLYIINHLIMNEQSSKSGGGIIGFLIKFSLEYHIYLIFILLGFYGTLYIIYKSISYIKSFLLKKFPSKINPIIIDISLLSILFLILLSYIIYEYIHNPIEIKEHLKRIFTLYLIIYITVRILIYAYKVTFQIGEQDFIDIKNLKIGNIVDKEYLINLFGTQSILGAPGENQNKEGLLYPDPKKYFLDVKKPIDDETIIKLNNIYEIVNEYHEKNKTEGFNKVNSIKILKTFSFGGYIFLGFIMSYFISDLIYKYLINILFEYLKIKS